MNEDTKPLRYKAIKKGKDSYDIGQIVIEENHEYKVVGFLNHGHEKIQLELNDPNREIKARFE